jgi:hypothetical protein
MSLKKIIVFFTVFYTLLLNGQSIKRNLLNANSIRFKNIVFVYGFTQNKGILNFNCYSFDYSLQLRDSTTYNFGKYTPSDFLEPTIDTLHNYLNFYFQLANQKNTVTLLRFNDTLGNVATTKNYDANHINALTTFDNEKYIYKNQLFLIKKIKDSLDDQFYLFNYNLKSIEKPFEYEQHWQFSFGRKHIQRATIIYADSINILTYVNVIDGQKTGQWLLKINSQTGELIKGAKLNPKEDSRHFLLSNFLIDHKLKNIHLMGSVYDKNMIDFKNEKSDFKLLAKKQTLFLIAIDSLGDITSRVEKLFPTPIQTVNGKNLISYHLKLRDFKKKNGDFEVWADLYEQSKPLVFSYYTSWHINITRNDVDYAFTPSNLKISSAAIPNYISYTNGDSYAKFALKTIKEYDKFKYQLPLNEYLVQTGVDDLNNGYYILKKTDILAATKSYYHIFSGKKDLEKKLILFAEQGQKANMYFFKKNKYITFLTNISNTEFEFKLQSL